MKRFSLLTAMTVCLSISATAQLKELPEKNSLHVPFRFSFQLTGNSKNHYLHIDEKGPIKGFHNSVLLFEGFVKNNRLNGSWKSWYENGKLLDSGTLVKGIPDGIWKVWDANGNVRALRVYDADLYQRIKNDLELNHPRFSNFTITERYKKEGSTILNYLGVSYSFKEAAAGKNSTLEEFVLQNQYNPSAYHPVFIECLHHGLYINYFENGSVKDSGYYKNGLRDGVWIHRSTAGGSFWKGAYKNGVRQYEWKEYNPNGRLITLAVYNNKGEEVMMKKM